jgi:hypothetical protein
MPAVPFVSPAAALAVAASFAAGLLASQLWVRDAHAQAAPFAATIYVPSDGLAFRTFDGRVIARLSYDAHGGVFALYDEHEQPVANVRAESFGRVPSGAATPASTSRTSREPDLGF